jgi:hypothetical protein
MTLKEIMARKKEIISIHNKIELLKKEYRNTDGKKNVRTTIILYLFGFATIFGVPSLLLSLFF